jgi:hypothetical protein
VLGTSFKNKPTPEMLAVQEGSIHRENKKRHCIDKEGISCLKFFFPVAQILQCFSTKNLKCQMSTRHQSTFVLV